ncbi:MAG: DUF882 domain-containing protein [Myxococcales bacterium]|nr:DUF882 domain-containing protein [Myxococcales bacterium]
MTPSGSAGGRAEGASRRRQAVALFVGALAAALVVSPPAALGDEAGQGEDERDRQEGESRTGRVGGPDDCVRGTADSSYEEKLRAWRTPRDLRPHRWVRGFREVTFRNIHTNRSAKLRLFGDDGELTAEAKAEIRRIWSDSVAGDGREIKDRLIKILYFVAVKFNAEEIVIISGFRDDRNESVTSPHWQGRAADIIVPGTSSRRVWEYVQTYGKVGVGRYPVSGFVHVDVRNASFFWEDVSGPGQPSCYYQVDRDLARRYDEEYDPHHDDPRRLRAYHDWQEQRAKQRRRAD